MGEPIRLRYSGFILFFSQIASVFTGLATVVTVTRSLTPADFGALNSIMQLVGTLAISATIFPFWSSRYVARKFEGAMLLGLLLNICLSIVALAILVVVSPFFASAAGTSPFNFLYGSLLVAELYITNSLVAVVAIRKPQVSGYAFILSEITKVASIVLLAAILRLGVFGAMTAYAVANLVQIIVYAFTLRELWFERLSFKYLSEWIKGSLFNIYGASASALATIGPYILLFSGGPLALAFYGAAIALTVPINYTQSLSVALYPKLLTDGTSKDIEILWRLSLLFSLPLTIAIIFLSPSLLAVLNFAYVRSFMTVVLFSVSYFVGSFSGFFYKIIIGTEKLDLHGAVGLRHLAGSRVFKATTASFVTNGLSLPLLWLGLRFVSNDAIAAGEVIASVSLGVNLVQAAALYIWAERCISFRFPTSSAVRYCGAASLLMLIVPFIGQPLRYFVTIPLFLAGTIVYFLLVYLVDQDAKILLKEIANYLLPRHFRQTP